MPEVSNYKEAEPKIDKKEINSILEKKLEEGLIDNKTLDKAIKYADSIISKLNKYLKEQYNKRDYLDSDDTDMKEAYILKEVLVQKINDSMIYLSARNNPADMFKNSLNAIFEEKEDISKVIEESDIEEAAITEIIDRYNLNTTPEKVMKFAQEVVTFADENEDIPNLLAKYIGETSVDKYEREHGKIN